MNNGRKDRAGFGSVGRVPSADRTVLPDGSRRVAAAVVVLAATIFAVLAVRYAGESTAGGVDGHLDRAVDALPATGHGLARAVTVFGSPPVVTVAAGALALLCLLARKPRAALLAVAGPGLTGLVTTFGKPVVDRTIGREESLAFPSGHTGGATSLALVCAAAAGRRARAPRARTPSCSPPRAPWWRAARSARGWSSPARTTRPTSSAASARRSPACSGWRCCSTPSRCADGPRQPDGHALAGATASSGVRYGMCACTRSCTNRSFPSTFGASTNG